MSSGTLIIVVIAAVFIFLAGKHASNRATAKKRLEDDELESQPGDLALTAKRDSFDDVMLEAAPVPKQKPIVVAKKAGPRGATKVNPDVDYSVYDAPTYQRRGLQLSF